MNALSRLLSLLALVLAAATLATGCNRAVSAPSTPAPAATPASAATAAPETVGVDAFMKNPARYPDTVIVKGVVAATDDKTSRLALIDVAELEACGTTTCATLSLPVSWQGKLPAIGDRVLVTGKVEQQQEGKLFVAQALRVLPDKAAEPAP